MLWDRSKDLKGTKCQDLQLQEPFEIYSMRVEWYGQLGGMTSSPREQVFLAPLGGMKAVHQMHQWWHNGYPPAFEPGRRSEMRRNIHSCSSQNFGVLAALREWHSQFPVPYGLEWGWDYLWLQLWLPLKWLALLNIRSGIWNRWIADGSLFINICSNHASAAFCTSSSPLV